MTSCVEKHWELALGPMSRVDAETLYEHGVLSFREFANMATLALADPAQRWPWRLATFLEY